VWWRVVVVRVVGGCGRQFRVAAPTTKCELVKRDMEGEPEREEECVYQMKAHYSCNRC